MSQIIKDFELKTASEKVASLHFFILEAGIYTSGKLDPVYFDLISALTELELNPESQPIISEKSFLDESSLCDIPDLEDLPVFSYYEY